MSNRLTEAVALTFGTAFLTLVTIGGPVRFLAETVIR